MAEQRVQIAYHWKADPAQLIPGAVRIPEMITRTMVVGDDLKTEKVSSAVLTPTDRAALLGELDKQTKEANRVARPAEESEATTAAAPGSAAAANPEEEMEAF
jgi:hypothetical protein